MVAVGSGEQALAEVKLLIDKMASERSKWQVSTSVYGASYVVVRVVLIVSSAIVAVAAEKGLSGPLSWLATWVPALALVVTILTTICPYWRGSASVATTGG